jgi:hypothetical protein
VSRADEFERLYNELDAYLRTLVDADLRKSFGDVLVEASQRSNAVRHMRDEIRDYADLRNAIVHRRGKNGIRVIAEPVQEAVAALENIVESVTRPKPITSIGGSVNPFDAGRPLAEALIYMKEQAFSQLVIEQHGSFMLLTTAGIANWLEHQVSIGLADIANSTIADVLSVEPTGSYAFLPRTATVYDAREKFVELPAATTERLFAILVTHSGRRTESVIRIVTPWDIVNYRSY